MINDHETNKVYFSDLLPIKFPEIYEEIIFHLKKYDISHELIENTSDIWCRDYMPVQINREQFVQFNFCPSYLSKFKKYQHLITNTDKLSYSLNKKQIFKSPIRLDGGNVVKFDNKVIVTDRVFEENKTYSFYELISELKNTLKGDNLIIIPQLPGDFTGHSDGMVRFINGNTVLVNNFSSVKSGSYFQALKLSLINTGLNLVELPYNTLNNKSLTDDTGNYINFLEVGNLLFIPFYGNETDGLVHYDIKNNFPDRLIIPIYCNELSKHGGCLNCITWTVKSD